MTDEEPMEGAKKATGTPPPWRLIPMPDVEGVPHFDIKAGDGVVGTGFWLSGAMSEDDARVLAAARELLAECQDARAIFAALMAATHKSPGPTLKEIDAAFRRLDALISRIEGEN